MLVITNEVGWKVGEDILSTVVIYLCSWMVGWLLITAATHAHCCNVFISWWKFWGKNIVVARPDIRQADTIPTVSIFIFFYSKFLFRRWKNTRVRSSICTHTSKSPKIGRPRGEKQIYFFFCDPVTTYGLDDHCQFDEFERKNSIYGLLKDTLSFHCCTFS